MSVASIIVLFAVIALAAFAVRRCLKKGMPCECGGSCKGAGCSCGCCSNSGK